MMITAMSAVVKAAMRPAVRSGPSRMIRPAVTVLRTATHRNVAWPQRRCIVASAAQAAAPEQVQVEQLAGEGDDQLRLNVRVPAARVKTICDGVIDSLRGDYKIPGFRDTTKVPASLVIKAAGGEARVKMAYVEACLHETMEEAFAGYADGLLDGSQQLENDFETLINNFDSQKEFEYIASAEQGDIKIEYPVPYTGLEITVEQPTTPEAEKMQVEMMIAQFLKENGGQMTVVSDRGLVMGDMLIVDMVTRKAGTDETLPGMGREQMQIDTSEEGSFFPGLLDQLVGIKPGESRVLPFTFPPESDELAGVEAEVFVKANELFEWKLPMLTLELVQQSMPEVTSLEQLRASLLEGVQYTAQSVLVERIHNEIGKHLVDTSVINKLPKSTFRSFALEQYSDYLKEAINKGELEQSQLEQFTTEEAAEVYINYEREMLEARFKLLIILDDIYSREGLTVDEGVVKNQVQQIVQQAAESQQQIDVEEVQSHVREQAKTMAAMAFVQENAKVTIVPAAQEA